jgi:hypothetical protein
MSDDLDKQLAPLWTLCQFDSHVTDWLAQLSKTDAQKQHQKQYEDTFPVFEKIDELLDERKNLENAIKSGSPLGIEAAHRLISTLDEEVSTLYLSIGLGPDGKTPATSMVKETTEQRRARWLAMLEAEEKREKRGALQRVANSEGVDRSNMRKDIDKALAARDKQKRAGAWNSQLVQDGKRKV